MLHKKIMDKKPKRIRKHFKIKDREIIYITSSEYSTIKEGRENMVLGFKKSELED